MKKVNFKGLDPDDLHTCQKCQHSFHDIGMCQKVCAKSGQPIAPMDYIQVNDCEEYKSPYLSDYRRRTDLENQLKTSPNYETSNFKDSIRNGSEEHLPSD